MQDNGLNHMTWTRLCVQPVKDNGLNLKPTMAYEMSLALKIATYRALRWNHHLTCSVGENSGNRPITDYHP